MSKLNVLLTGASSGIGHELLRRFLSRGAYSIYVMGNNKPTVLPAERFIRCDFADIRHLKQACEAMPLPVHDVDVLINNAGTSYFAGAHRIPLDEWQRVINVNLTAAFYLTSLALPGMLDRNRGTVVSISSDADANGFATGAAYAASKFGLRGLIESVQSETKGTAVKAALISPARVDTNFNGKKPGDRPLALSPTDVAEAVDYVLNTSPRCLPEVIRLRSTLE